MCSTNECDCLCEFKLPICCGCWNVFLLIIFILGCVCINHGNGCEYMNGMTAMFAICFSGIALFISLCFGFYYIVGKTVGAPKYVVIV